MKEVENQEILDKIKRNFDMLKERKAILSDSLHNIKVHYCDGIKNLKVKLKRNKVIKPETFIFHSNPIRILVRERHRSGLINNCLDTSYEKLLKDIENISELCDEEDFFNLYAFTILYHLKIEKDDKISLMINRKLLMILNKENEFIYKIENKKKLLQIKKNYSEYLKLANEAKIAISEIISKK